MQVTAREPLLHRLDLELALAHVLEVLGRPEEHVDQRPDERHDRSEEPLEIWDGAHNVAGVGWLLGRLPSRRYVVVASILADKNVDGMLEALSVLGDAFVATRSSNARALPAAELARRAARFFPSTEVVEDPAEARKRGRELAGPDGALLVTGSLYLLADLS